MIRMYYTFQRVRALSSIIITMVGTTLGWLIWSFPPRDPNLIYVVVGVFGGLATVPSAIVAYVDNMMPAWGMAKEFEAPALFEAMAIGAVSVCLQLGILCGAAGVPFLFPTIALTYLGPGAVIAASIGLTAFPLGDYAEWMNSPLYFAAEMQVGMWEALKQRHWRVLFLLAFSAMVGYLLVFVVPW